jgi:hypothetical protein
VKGLRFLVVVVGVLFLGAIAWGLLKPRPAAAATPTGAAANTGGGDSIGGVISSVTGLIGVFGSLFGSSGSGSGSSGSSNGYTVEHTADGSKLTD